MIVGIASINRPNSKNSNAMINAVSKGPALKSVSHSTIRRGTLKKARSQPNAVAVPIAKSEIEAKRPVS